LLHRLRLRHIVAPPALEEMNKYYQLHLHRDKVPLATIHLRGAGELSVAAWWRRRMFEPLLRRLRQRNIVAPPALEDLSIYRQLHLH
jgi:hypothetical protein